MNITTSSSQERFKRIFTHNLREKTIAAVCAAVFLMLSLCFKPVTKIYSVKVDAKISPDQVVVSSSTDHVEVKVSGNFFELSKIKNDDLVIKFDFSSEKAGEISRTIDETLFSSSFAALDVKNIVPQMLVLKTEDKKVKTAPEPPVETLTETSPKEEKPVETSPEQKPAETSPETSPEQKPVETLPETSPKKPASERKND